MDFFLDGFDIDINPVVSIILTHTGIFELENSSATLIVHHIDPLGSIGMPDNLDDASWILHSLAITIDQSHVESGSLAGMDSGLIGRSAGEIPVDPLDGDLHFGLLDIIHIGLDHVVGFLDETEIQDDGSCRDRDHLIVGLGDFCQAEIRSNLEELDSVAGRKQCVGQIHLDGDGPVVLIPISGLGLCRG